MDAARTGLEHYLLVRRSISDPEALAYCSAAAGEAGTPGTGCRESVAD